ncbi:Calretinin [Takifugu flavidus]|uniref:Calretinin n=1 Tax=Takifugu flavidus TaxID=433684 RepID=A0A5C6PBN2_9TELE|nr:Calretinin [Takifugu flavidus]
MAGAAQQPVRGIMAGAAQQPVRGIMAGAAQQPVRGIMAGAAQQPVRGIMAGAAQQPVRGIMAGAAQQPSEASWQVQLSSRSEASWQVQPSSLWTCRRPPSRPPSSCISGIISTLMMFSNVPISILVCLYVTGNGYIEEKELESFFKELEVAWRGADIDPSNPMLKERVKDFVQQFDKNKDGRIEMSELAEILPNEENFLLCFRQFVKSGTEFMKVSVAMG